MTRLSTLVVLLVILCWVPRVEAAVGLPEACTGNFSGASTATCNMTIAAGSGVAWYIVIIDTDTITGLTDSGSNTHTAAACNVNPLGNVKYCYGISCAPATTGALTFTGTASSTVTSGWIEIVETTGQATSSCQHGTPPAANVQLLATALTTGTHTVTQDGVGLLAFIVEDGGPVSITGTGAFNWYQGHSTPNGASAALAQATAANVAATATAGGVSNFVSFVFAISPAGGATGPPPGSLATTGAGL